MGYGCLNAQSVGANGEFEYRLAQEIAFYLFAKDFKDRHGGGVFTSERSYLWEKDPNDKNSDLLFDVMATYFRNWVPPRSFKKNPSTRREGGMRKPDGMGISPKKSDGSVVTELIEVKPAKDYKAGEQQMREMLDKLREGVKGYIEERRLIESFDPGIRAESYKFSGSPWTPSLANCSYPLTPINNASPGQMRWICYKPTRSYRIQLLPGVNTAPPEREGVILYEIHSVDLQRSKEAFDQLPQSVRQGIQQAFARAVRQNRSANELRLNPLDPDLFARNAAAKAKLRDQMLLLGAGLLVGVVLLCVFAPPAGAAAAGVVGGEVATMAAAETTSLAVAGEEVFLGYRVAPMIRVAGELMRYEEAVNPAMELAEEVGRAVMMR